MKYVLDFKDEVTVLFPEKGNEYKETFYRYLITTDDNKTLATIWFTQHENRNIYSVGCQLNSDKLEPYFNLYYNVPIDGPVWKPENYDISLKHNIIADKDFNKIHSGLQMLQYVANCGMTIFEDEEHKR